jgi:hypothetical protein
MCQINKDNIGKHFEKMHSKKQKKKPLKSGEKW